MNVEIGAEVAGYKRNCRYSAACNAKRLFLFCEQWVSAYDIISYTDKF
jgi:hypothetical protein